MGPRETTTKSRLGQISHHFLSDQLPSDMVESEPFIISILTQLQDRCFYPVDALAHALLIRGLPSITVNTNYGSPTVCRHVLVRNKPILYKRTQQNKSNKGLNVNKLEEQLDNNKHDKTQICFMPVASPDSQYLELSDVIIIPAMASTEGIQSAYSTIKKANKLKQNAMIGVTIIEAKDHVHAQECFDKLAQAVKRFLELDIISYGYLPVYKPPGDALPDNDTHSLYPLCISGIVDLITLDRKEWLENKDMPDKSFQPSRRIECEQHHTL